MSIGVEQTITSIEAAEMLEKTHANLMKDIRRYAGQLAEVKIDLGDFFRESTYKDVNNQTRPCYQITKKGCEFIAHKLTGTKGTAFTARYINRFHEMEDLITERQTPNRQKQIEQALIDAKNLLEEKEKKIKELEAQSGRGYNATWYRQEIQRYTSIITDRRRLSQIYTIAMKMYQFEREKAV